MPTYISLCRWTQQGVQNIKESPNRLDAAEKGVCCGWHQKYELRIHYGYA